ncbi:hypothetical protein [Mammaliicoccus sp. E-M24]|uniref:hypothetical protein n=1 Tax=Mammaliicoccus sp. E-M24 TaxID=2898684 RepID=UPI001EFAECA0|nr:hypothetical protein [Mammaliicoccus sp. E-M24]
MEYKNESFITDLAESYSDEIFSEVKEVYAKAKAFDEIVKLRNSYYSYSKKNSSGLIALLNAKTFGREVSHLINKKGYVEDK